MAGIRKAAPIVLMGWPYLSVFVLVSPEYGRILPGYIFLTVVVYGWNVWNAWSYPLKDTRRGPGFWDMAVKLMHIPFYVGVFVIGMLLILAMVVPAFLIVSPILVGVLAAVDVCLMLTSSMYGISVIVRLLREGRIAKGFALLHIILHLFFVADVISAVWLYRTWGKKG